MQYLLGLVGLLLGALGWNFFKRRSAEALLQNNEVKSKLNKLDQDKALNNALLEAETQKLEEHRKAAKERKNKPVDPTDF